MLIPSYTILGNIKSPQKPILFLKPTKSFLSIVMLFAIFFQLQNAAAMPSGDYLVAHWPLDEGTGSTVSDISGKGNNALLTNGPVWNGNQIVFDGVNDYIDAGIIDISGSALTLTGWVKANRLENCRARDCRILSKAIGTATQDHYWMVGTIKVGSLTRLRFRLKTNGSTKTLVATTGDITNGEQFHVAAVYDGSTMRLYKNGIEVGSTDKTGTIDTNNAVKLWIAGNPTVATARPWDGSIADVRIYQKALTESEVNAIKNDIGSDDTTPPVISNIQSVVTDTTSTITWETNEPSNSQISFGLTLDYENGVINYGGLVKSHSLRLTGLTPETTYQYQADSTDANGNIFQSNNFTITTLATGSDPGNNLVAHWPMDEGSGLTIKDISGNENNAALTNEPVWNGNQLIFDGVNDYVDAGTIDVSGNALTVTGWIKANELENCAARDCRILSKATGTATEDHYWMVGTIKVGSSTRLRFRLKANGSTKTLVAATGDITNGEQFHVAAVYDGNTMRLYKNGIEVGNTSKTGNIDTNNTVKVWIAGNPTVATARPWDGSIADVRIYQKALTENEVNDVKNEVDINDTTPPVISNIQTTITDTTATINWETNETADATVKYGLDNTIGSTSTNPNQTRAHSITLTGLSANTEYHYLISSTDGSGNLTSIDNLTLRTIVESDTTSPIITNIQSTVTDTTATISWDTNEISDSLVEYGLSNSHGLSTSDPNLSSTHHITLVGLEVDTKYHFSVSSSDVSGNISNSYNITFRTTLRSGTDSDLIAHWPLNEGTGLSAVDISGNGNNAVLKNTPLWNENHLIFDGVNDYIDAGSLDVSGTEITLSAWVQASQLENCTARDCRIFSKASGTAENDHYWMIGTTKVSSETRLRFRLKTNGTTKTLVASTGNLTNGDQFHVAAVYDGNTMRLYKDGIEIGNAPKTGSINTSNTVKTWIGGNPPNASGRPWDGSIAHVRVYQKALSAVEINALKESDTVTDITSPLIRNIKVSTTESTATITWDTSEVSEANVSFGLNSTYNNGTVSEDIVSASHTITLTDLAPNTTYHYQLNSTDINGNKSTSGDLTFKTFLAGGGPDLLVYDLNRIVTTRDHGFPRNFPPTANGNWVSPINYAEGTFHMRAEIKSQPIPQTMRIQYCVWQYTFTLENCAPIKTVEGTSGNVVIWQGKVTSMYMKGGNPIDWENPRQTDGLAIKNSAGVPISDFKNWNWGGFDPDDVYPLDMRFTLVVVPKGQTFSGWENFIN